MNVNGGFGQVVEKVKGHLGGRRHSSPLKSYSASALVRGLKAVVEASSLLLVGCTTLGSCPPCVGEEQSTQRASKEASSEVMIVMVLEAGVEGYG